MRGESDVMVWVRLVVGSLLSLLSLSKLLPSILEDEVVQGR